MLTGLLATVLEVCLWGPLTIQGKKLPISLKNAATGSPRTPNTHSTASLPETQSSKIRDAEDALAQAIQEDGVSKAQLSHFYNSYRNISDDARLLSQFPQKTALAFRALHAALQEEIHRQMNADGKGPEFFQTPTEQSMPPQMIAHAITLEQLDVNSEAKKFIEQVAQAREVTTSNIERLAELCRAHWPCIEKGAYTWIKANHILSTEQHQLIQHYNAGS